MTKISVLFKPSEHISDGERTLKKQRWKNRYLSAQFFISLLWKVMRQVILIGLCFLIIYPLFVKFVTSFASESDLFDPTVKFFPRQPGLSMIRQVANSLNYGKTLINTALLSLLVGLCQLVVSALAAYGFARFKPRGSSILFALTMMTLMVPQQVILTPLFLQFKNFMGLNLLNTFWPFAIISLTGLGLKNGLYIYMLRQLFRGLPKELEESAYIDGAGTLRTFVSIVLPNAIPMMVTVFLFSFTWQWTENVYTPLFLPQTDVFSRLMPMVASVTRDGPERYSALSNTAALLIIIPILLLFLLLQRHFVESMERSGLVG